MTDEARKNAFSLGDNKVQYCTFWISNRLFGVDILDVKEIFPEVVVTPVFHAPKEVRGYVNIRGQIYLILDLRLILSQDEKPVDDDSCLVLFKNSIGEPFGVLVDKIGDVVLAGFDQLEKRKNHLPEGDGKEDFIECICKMDKALLTVLNAVKILQYIYSAKEEG
ncbi:MAG: chemotaxis protein CheW [Nitrospinae bacterium]|nr:chemotaxis protein CheW [Nitrospinota bacterium]